MADGSKGLGAGWSGGGKRGVVVACRVSDGVTAGCSVVLSDPNGVRTYCGA